MDEKSFSIILNKESNGIKWLLYNIQVTNFMIILTGKCTFLWMVRPTRKDLLAQMVHRYTYQIATQTSVSFSQIDDIEQLDLQVPVPKHVTVSRRSQNLHSSLIGRRPWGFIRSSMPVEHTKWTIGLATKSLAHQTVHIAFV